MALQPQSVVVPVGGGIANDTADKLLPNGKLLLLENSYVNQTGKLQKRPGTAALSAAIAPSGTLPNVWQLATHRDGLIALSKVGAQPIFRWSPTTGEWTATSATSAPTRGPLTVSKVPFAGAATQAQNPDMALSGNYIALAYEYGLVTNQSVEAIIDGATGKGIYSTTPAGVRPRVLTLNGAFVFIWVNPADNKVYFDKWVIANLATVGTPTQTSAAASAHATNPFMDAVATGADTIAVAYQKSDNTVWGIQYTVSTGVAGAPFQFKDSAAANIAATQCLGWTVQVFATSPVLLIADGTAGVKSHIYGSGVGANAATSTTIDAAATANVRNVTGVTVSASDHNVLYEITGASPWLTQVKAATKVGGVVTAGIFQRSVGLRSRPWLGPDSQIYAVFTYDSTTQASYFVMAVPSDPVGTPYTVPLARLATWTGNGKTEKAGCLASMLSYSTGGIVPLITRTRLETQGASTFFDLGVSIYKLGQNDRIGRAEEAAGTLNVPGAMLQSFDGVHYFEASWHVYPEGLAVAYSNSGGGLVTGNTYNWIVVYRWVDSQGRMRRSVQSAPLQGTVTAANNTATITVPNCRLTSFRDTGPQVELYRTIAGGTAYYRVQNTPNNYQSDTAILLDVTSDANLVNGELLYTSGGALSSQPAPALFAIEQFDQRLVGIDAEDRSLIRMTSQFVDGVAPIWNENLTIRLNTQWGDATGLAAMDGKLLIFFRNAIYYIAGVGPNASGVGTYNNPVLIASGTGCAENQAQSIIYTGRSVMFLADVGIQEISRGLAITDKGMPVQKYTDAGVTVTAAIQFPKFSQIRFYTTAGTTLVYDYLHEVWGVFTGQASVTAAMWAQTPVYANTNVVLAESAAVFTEAGVAYAHKITSPDLALAGLDSFFRLYTLHGVGEWLSAHTLAITLVYDYDTANPVNVTVTPNNLWQWAYENARKCTTVRVTLSDGACVGAGFSIEALAFEIGVKPGLRRLSDDKRAQ